MTDDEIIDLILLREGGFVNRSEDRGGPTNHGITIDALREYRGTPVTLADVQALTESEARDIYRESYVAPFNWVLPPDLRGMVVDAAVNHGPQLAAKLLQRAVKVDDDGIIGDQTRTALYSMTWQEAYRRVGTQRLRLYGRIVNNDTSQAVFISGWINRIADLLDEVA